MPAKKISVLLLFGLVAAGIMILVMLGTWLAGPEAFLGPPVWLGRSLVILLAAIAAAVAKRARGGAIDFQAALKVAFGVMVMGIIAQSLMVWLIPNVIDPHFNQRLVPVMLDKAQRSYHEFGVPDDQIRQALNDIRTNNQFSLGRVIQGAGPQFLLFGVIAILIAVTVKSKKGSTPKPQS